MEQLKDGGHPNRTLFVVYRKDLDKNELVPVLVELGDAPDDFFEYVFKNELLRGQRYDDILPASIVEGDCYGVIGKTTFHCLDQKNTKSDYLVARVDPTLIRNAASQFQTDYYNACYKVSKMIFSHKYEIINTTELAPGNVYYYANAVEVDKPFKSKEEIFKMLGKREESIEEKPFGEAYASAVESAPKTEAVKKKAEVKQKVEIEEDSSPVDIENCNVREVINSISARIVRQEEAIRTIVTNVYYNQMLIKQFDKKYNIDPVELKSRKVNIFLEGSTGTGKTAIIESVANRFNIPVVIRSAASFSETGYVGSSLTDVLKDLFFAAGRDLSKAQRGIIVFDEIDKLAVNQTPDGRDMKKGVQDELLGLIGGGTFDFPLDERSIGGQTIHFDTSMVTFILGGAWTNIRDKKVEDYKKEHSKIGFTNEGSIAGTTIEYTITADDYIKAGLSREFFGRVKVLTGTRTYNLDDLRAILMESITSPIKNFEKAVQMFGYPGIEVSDEFVQKVCEQAFQMQTGARALESIMAGVQNRFLEGLILKELDPSKPIVLTTDILDEYNKSLVRTAII